MSTGTGTIQLLNRAPHPSAAKVYINRLLTKVVQARLSAATKQNSARLNVPVAYLEVAPDPQHFDSYFPAQVEETLPLREKAQQIAREVC